MADNHQGEKSMKKKLSENDVLNELGVTSFDQINKNNIVEFLRLFKDIDPEVANNTLKLIPDFAVLVREVVVSYKASYEMCLSSNEKSYMGYVDNMSRIIDALTKMCEQSNNTTEDKRMIIDTFLILEQRMASMDENNKMFIASMNKRNNDNISTVCKVIIGASLLAVGIALGARPGPPKIA